MDKIKYVTQRAFDRLFGLSVGGIVILTIVFVLTNNQLRYDLEDIKGGGVYANSIAKDKLKSDVFNTVNLQLEDGKTIAAQLVKATIKDGALTDSLEFKTEDGDIYAGKIIGGVGNSEFSGDLILNGSINEEKLSTAVINKIENGTTNNAFEIPDGSIVTAKLAKNAVTTDKLADGSVATIKLLDGSITSSKLTDGVILTQHLADNSITSFKIADNAVTTTKLLDNIITTVKVQDQAITTPKLADNAVTEIKLANGSVTELKIVDGSVTNGKIADGSVTAFKLANDAVITAKILDGNVTEAKLASGSISLGKLSNAMCSNGEILQKALGVWVCTSSSGLGVQSVTAGAGLGDSGTALNPILDANVDNVTIEISADTLRIKDGAITTAKLADGSVITAKIVDGNITNSKLQDNAVTTNKVLDGAITSAKILDGTITYADIANAAAIAWSKLSKTGSSLADLTTRNASDLNITDSGNYYTSTNAEGALQELGASIATINSTAFVNNGNNFGGAATLGTIDANSLTFITSNAPRMTLLAGGNVGVGDATPASLFTVGANDAFQVNSSGNIVKIGGANHSLSNSSGNLTLTSAGTLAFDDNITTGPVPLTITDTALNGALRQSIIDSINDVYGLATTGGGSSLWSLNSNVIYPTTTTRDLAIGGNSSAASLFYSTASQLLTLTNTTAGNSFVINDAAGDTTPFVVDANGQLGIGDATPDYNLEVSSPLGSDSVFALSDGDVTHGLTTLAQTDVFAHLGPISSTNGGAQLTGISDADAQALLLRGIIGSTNPTDTISAVKIIGGKSNGTTGMTALDTTETVFQVSNDTTNLLSILGNGYTGFGVAVPATAIDILKDENIFTTLRLRNSNAGTNAGSRIALTEDGTNVSGFFYSNSGYTSATIYKANQLSIFAGSTATNGLLLTTSANAPIAFATGGTATTNERLRILGTGEVGIGTTLPGAQLDINSAGGSNLRLTYNDNNGAAANYTDFTTASNGALTINSTGGLNLQPDGSINVNIAGGSGATGCTITNTTGDLTCTGNITGASTGTSGFWTRTGTTLSPSNSNDILSVTQAATGVTTNNLKDLSITASGSFNTTAGVLTNYASYFNNTSTRSAGANALTNVGLYVSASGAQNNYGLIVDQGNVGIGTTTPTYALEIQRNEDALSRLVVRNSNTGVAASESVSLSQDGTNFSGISLQNSGYNPVGLFNPNQLNLFSSGTATNGILVVSAANAPIVFATGGIGTVNERMRILGTGNVGIGGDTTPDSLFSVGSTSQFQVNSSGAIVAAAGINSSGTITFTGLNTAGLVTNTAGGQLGTTQTIGASYITADTLDFTEFKDNMTLDGVTDISATGTNYLSITNSGTGNSLVVNDQAADTTPFVIDKDGNVMIGNTTGTAPLNVGSSNQFQVSATGAVTAVGVNSGAGLLQGTGGATLTGTVVINTTGTSTTSIGNGTGTFSLASGGGLNVSTTGALTGVASIDTIGTTSTALTFAAGGTISATSTGLNLQSDGSVDVNIAGGVAGTGCTINNTTGDLSCTGSITGATTGTSGYWTRTGTTLSPATANDILSLNTNSTTAPALNIVASGNNVSGNATGLFINSADASTALPAVLITYGGSGRAFVVNDDGTLTDSSPFVIDGSGQVGIGIDTPGAKLDVAGDIRLQSGSIFMHNGTEQITALAQTAGAGSSLQLYGGKVTVKSTGEVGIGDASPTSLLTVGSSDEFQINSSGNIVSVGGGAHSISNVSGLTISAATTGLNLQADGSVDVNLAGGSIATGCTIANTTGNLTCTGSISSSNGTLASTLQNAYDNDANGSDTLITLSSNDDSLIFRNPATGGTDSANVLTLDNLETGNTDSNFKLLNVTGQGTFNTTAGVLTNYGGYFANTSTRSAGANALTNVGLYASASGAQNNYAAIFENGFVGIGTTAPSALLSVGSSSQFQVSAAGAVTAVGVNSGAGLLQGTGGITITGTASINTSGVDTTTIGSGSGLVTIANGTGNLALGNSTGTFALTSNGGLNVTTGGALTGVASIDTISTTSSALTFAAGGTISATSTGLNLQADGSVDVNLAGGSIATGCTIANTTGNLICTGTISGSNGTLASTLQNAYDNDANGSDTIISLTTNDDSLIVRNPATGGTDSTNILTLDNLETGNTDSNFKILNLTAQGSFNTTAGVLTNYGAFLSNTSTRSAGANALTNVGLYVTASGAQNNYAAIFDQGSVGIGTTTPTFTLDVNGTLRASSTSNAVFGNGTTGGVQIGDSTITKTSGNIFLVGSALSSAGVTLGNPLGGSPLGNGSIQLGESNTTGNIGVDSAKDIVFYTSGAKTGEILRLGASAGNVGIGGDTTPDSLFSVGSTSQFQVNSSGNIVAIGGAAHSFSNISGLTIDAAATGLNLQSDGSVNVNLAGGVTGTGCTITNTTGDLNCTGNIVGASSGTSGYWSRTGTVLSPATANDVLSLSTNSTTAPAINIVASGNNVSGNATALFINSSDNSTSLPAALITYGGSGRALVVNDDGTTTDTSPFVIDASGQVGIGISSPGAKLDVDGNVRIQNGTLALNNGTEQITALSQTAGAGSSLQLYSGKITVKSTGEVGIGDASPTSLLTVGASDEFQVNSSGNIINIGGAAHSISNSAGALNIDSATTGAINIGTGPNAKTITIGNNTTTTALNFTSGTGSQTFTSSATTNTAFNFVANSLTNSVGLNVTSTSATLGTGSVGSLYWNPASGSSATGDVLSLDVASGSNIGNILNVKNAGSSVFSVGQAQITANLPFNFTSPGDVSIAYDIQFTNQTASYIKSKAPLYLDAGESFESNDLTLRTYNAGQVVVDSAGGIAGPSASALNISASSTALNLQADGAINVNLAGGSSATGCTVDNATGNLTCTGNILGAATGTAGYWTRAGTTLSPTTAGDNITTTGSMAVGGSTLTSTFNVGNAAQFQVNSSGNIASIGGAAHTIANSAGALNIDSATTGAINIGTSANAKTITIGNNTTTTALAFTSGTGSQTFTSSATTNTAFAFVANSLTNSVGLNVTSTSATLGTGSVGSLYWNPASGSSATGDVLTLDVATGSNIGYILNVKNAGATVFGVSQAQVTSNLPFQVTAPGDVSVAYDLVFTNPTATFIKSSSNLSVVAGEPFNSSNLTLSTYNSGNIVFDNGGTTRALLTGAGNLGVGTTTPFKRLQVASSTVGDGILITSNSPGLTLANNDTLTSATMNFVLGLASTNGDYGLSPGDTLLGNYGNSRGNISINSNYSGTGTTNLLLQPGTGNVGVGNSAPGVKLHVGSASVVDATNLLRLEDANSTCNFNANTGSPSCGSDFTLKKDITSLDTNDLLGRITSLRPVSYLWQTDADNGTLKYGFVAQEVSPLFPELVTESTWIDGSTKKFLDIGGLVPYIVGAVKGQQDEIATIQAQLNTPPTSSAIVLTNENILDYFNTTIIPNFTVIKIRVNEELIAQSVIVIGDTKFYGTAEFNNDVNVRNKINLGKDSAGKAVIAVGDTSVEIKFTTPYPEVPIITATPTGSHALTGGIQFSITEVTTEGFKIELTNQATLELEFNWIAVGIDNVAPVSYTVSPAPPQP